jgi:hypothetical protein
MTLSDNFKILISIVMLIIMVTIMFILINNGG